MVENTTTSVELVEGQIDLFTNEVVEIESEESEESELSLEEIVAKLTEAAFGGDVTITAYKIATIINGVFKVVGFEKQIPPQMMYNYARNGLINKIKGVKQYTETEVTTFVLRYTKKQMGR